MSEPEREIHIHVRTLDPRSVGEIVIEAIEDWEDKRKEPPCGEADQGDTQ